MNRSRQITSLIPHNLTVRTRQTGLTERFDGTECYYIFLNVLGNQDVVGKIFESLILAQDERWRRALGMQVERSRRKAGEWRMGE